MKTKLNLLIAFLICLVFTAACGQKGPLFLPGSPSQMAPERVDPQTAPVQGSEEEDEEQTYNIN